LLCASRRMVLVPNVSECVWHIPDNVMSCPDEMCGRRVVRACKIVYHLRRRYSRRFARRRLRCTWLTYPTDIHCVSDVLRVRVMVDFATAGLYCCVAAVWLPDAFL